MTDTIISVASDFSATPGGRFEKDGEFSGEAFRNGVVMPLLKASLASGEKLHVDLDGTAGYATSFLEEAFGGLVRALGRPLSGLLVIDTKNAIRKREVEGYIADAESKLR
jgi:STAS-like domain of unknown function (DUF4325)